MLIKIARGFAYVACFETELFRIVCCYCKYTHYYPLCSDGKRTVRLGDSSELHRGLCL